MSDRDESFTRVARELAEAADYITQLESAVNVLWGWIPKGVFAQDLPELAEFCRAIHQKVDHR